MFQSNGLTCLHVFGILVYFELLFIKVHSVDSKMYDYSLTPFSDYPYIVLVKCNIKKSFCTGSLLTVKWVLVAAHCVNKENDNSITVFSGNFSKEDVGKFDDQDAALSSVKQSNNVSLYQSERSMAILMPWSYLQKPLFGNSDIALVQLEAKFHFNRWLRRAPVQPLLTSSSTNCKLVGFSVSPNYPNYLSPKHFTQGVTQLLVRSLLVQRMCEHNSKLVVKSDHRYRSWICQLDNRSVNQTLANSGALLFCKINLNGVAVGNFKASSDIDKNTEPLVFTDICPYLTWIRNFVGPSVMYSPGEYGTECFNSTIKTCYKLHFSLILLVICNFLSQIK